MAGDDPLPTLPAGCVAGCLLLTALGAVLILAGFELAGQLAVFLTWAALLVEALRSREVAFLRHWSVRRDVKPLAYWGIATLFLVAAAASFYFLVETVRT
jgi:hypothetical protein